MQGGRIALAMLAVLAVASAPARQAEAPYLTSQAVPDGLVILPPPPAPGSATAKRDRAVFVATRRLIGSPRWRIATDDADNAPLARYACAMNMRLTPAAAPALAHLIDRIGTRDTVDPVKAHYAVRRPYLGTDAPICEPKTAHLAATGDYPSGHAANGWLEGLVLAELMPAHASQILARARAYGESRAVCGAHSLSAVEAGWMAGAATFAAMQASAGFQRDLELARRELAESESVATRPDPTRCAAEAAALAPRPW